MCEQCLEEDDEMYEGESIQEKRQKALDSVIQRHPELGLDPEDVILRFSPQEEESCIRTNLTAGEPEPTYEIHAPGTISQARRSSPPLAELAKVAWIETDLSYQEICDTLTIHFSLPFDAFFLSDSPPINPVRSENGVGVRQYEANVTDQVGSDDSD